MSLKILVPFPVIRGDIVGNSCILFPAVRSKESSSAMCARTITDLNWHRKCERDKKRREESWGIARVDGQDGSRWVKIQYHKMAGSTSLFEIMFDRFSMVPVLDPSQTC